jgi:hypothetical protein
MARPASNQRPKVDFPASKSPKALTTVEVRLLFDEPKPYEGDYGTSYIYSVEHDGQEKVFFASGGLHKRIQELEPRKGDLLGISRLGEGKETRWFVDMLEGATTGAEAPRPPARDSDPSRPPAARPRASQSFEEEQARYWLAFDYAIEQVTARGLTPSVDANAIAFVFYKMLGDHGLTSFTRETPAPEPAPVKAADAPDAEREKMRTTLEGIFRETNLPSKEWMSLFNGLRSEDEREVFIWDDVSLETGRAAYAYATTVRDGVTSWGHILKDLNIETGDSLPF